MKSIHRFVLGSAASGTVLASLAFGVDPAVAAPRYVFMRQLTNITTGTIEAAKIQMQDGVNIAFVSTGDVMGPGTQTAERQVYLWSEQANGNGVITRVTNLPGCESYDISRSTDTVLSDRPSVIAFVSTCDIGR